MPLDPKGDAWPRFPAEGILSPLFGKTRVPLVHTFGPQALSRSKTCARARRSGNRTARFSEQRESGLAANRSTRHGRPAGERKLTPLSPLF